jgi:hypothetical protein
MPIRSSRPAFAVAFIALSFTMLASAEFKSVGSAEIDMHLPGGTAGLSVNGKSSNLTAKESGGVLTVTAKLDCLTENKEHASCIKTGIAMRDKHVWKYLESGKFPEATLTVQRSQLKIPNDNEKSEGDATGTLSLHGVKRQLSFHYSAQRAGSDIQVHGQIKTNLKDFNVERPSFAGVHTGMLAEIKVQFKLRDN